MPEFLTLLPPHEALKKLLDEIKGRPSSEIINSADGLGRITVEEVKAGYPLPSFQRTTVDGYAVKAQDTHGASDTLPAYLRLVGEVPMGGAPGFRVGNHECALIHTGGMIPDGADAVVMVENTQIARDGEVEILRAVSNGENVLQIGEDVSEGQEVIPAGTKLRPAEIGGLMALGVTEITVAKQPVVGILSSGDEVVPPEEELRPGQVRDINSYTLRSLIIHAGGTPMTYGIVPDYFEAMKEKVGKAMSECDLVVITAGSSASTRDLTAKVIDELGEPGVLVHGVNVRPGKPTILGLCDGVPVIGLPGNPVSALVIAGLFVVPVIERLSGLKIDRPNASIPAKLTLNLSSKAGREDWIAVKLNSSETGYLAEPIFGKSNLIFTLVQADGLIRIPPSANGLEAGENVMVRLI